MQPCISQAATLPTSFADDITGYAEGGVNAVEIWLTKLEQHLQQTSPADTRRLLADRGIRPVAAAYQGGLLLSGEAERKVHYEHFKRRLDLCQYLGIPTVVLAADAITKPERTMLGSAVIGLAEAARWAQAFGVTLALEFRSRGSFCSSLDTALSLVAACGEPNVGVCLDLFHFYTGPSKFDDLALLTRDNLAHVQVCDLAGVPRELATDADRILPGEGDFHLTPIFERLRAIGYTGWVSLELMNPVLWQAKPASLAELGWQALERLTGPAVSSRKN
jgi:sugar phosphate isomerase/epimerase